MPLRSGREYDYQDPKAVQRFLEQCATNRQQSQVVAPLPQPAVAAASVAAAISQPAVVPAPAPVPAPALPPAPVPAATAAAQAPIGPGATMAPFRGQFKTRHAMLTDQDRANIEQDLRAATNTNDFINRVATRFPMWQWNLGALPNRTKNPPKWTKAELLLLVHEWEYGIFAEGSWAKALVTGSNKFGFHSWVLRRLRDWGFGPRAVNGIESMKSHLYKAANDWHNSPGLKTMARQLVSEGLDTSNPAVGHAGELIIRTVGLSTSPRGNQTILFDTNPHAW
ncbi:hypothetical protein DL546_000473 [Coniochaeta pulveracea]|uniref:Uncharacterized protein n=1 Tax=Coniochaeta pulveracea TaxID=177199 RepID=A0A420Y0I6_9PEZI|nr:hypothetical protein DL546_000473 [Coniochaeta pulveracea]